MWLPETIKSFIGAESFQLDDVGMSDSSVLIFTDKVLKIQKSSQESENEYRMMTWLSGKLPIPNILAYETVGDNTFLLMSKCPGEMSCDARYMENTKEQVALLAEGLKLLWAVDVTDCPSDQSLKNKLAMAEYNVRHGLVDLDNVEPDTFGENGFANPAALLDWLYENQPKEELVLSHGDYCLPNIFLKDNRVSGFIDFARTGIADKWCDLALCYRSLLHNYSGKYDGKSYSEFDSTLLFQTLGLEPDWDKIRYYILLDELF